MNKCINVGKWRIDVTQEFLSNNLLVSFYDMSQDKKSFPYGQFVSSYYLDTLLGKDELSISSQGLKDMPYFSLNLDVPEWTIYTDELKVIAEQLEQCWKYQNELNLQTKIDKESPYIFVNLSSSSDFQKFIDELKYDQNCLIYDVYDYSHVVEKQRDFHIDMSKTIDSCLIGLPLPLIYFVDEKNKLANNTVWVEFRKTANENRAKKDIILDKTGKVTDFSNLVNAKETQEQKETDSIQKEQEQALDEIEM